MTHICVDKLMIIVSDNGLSPDRRQAIIWTNAGLLSIGPLRTYFSGNLIKIQQFSLKKMHVKMSSAKWRPSCLGLNVLNSYMPWIYLRKQFSAKSMWFPLGLLSLSSGVGVTKPIFSVALFSIFSVIVKTDVSYWISRLYLAGVAAAQLRWHLSNTNVILGNQVLLQHRKFCLRRN